MSVVLAAVTGAPPATLDGLVRVVHRFLREAFRGQSRADAAGLDARLIVAAASGMAVARLPMIGDQAVGEDAAAAAWGMARQRAAGMPTARILGRKEFWSMELELSPAVLVPRPDTETVVATALDWLEAGARRDEGLRLLDLGTGSGAILLALLHELPVASGIGVDADPAALAIARRNAERLGLGRRARFVAADWASPLVGNFDLIVTNPPYVESGAIAGLDDEVRAYDPTLALDGGSDGLDAYRAIAPDLERLLAPNGSVVLEVGAGQAPAVARLLGGVGLVTELWPDLACVERVVSGQFPRV